MATSRIPRALPLSLCGAALLPALSSAQLEIRVDTIVPGQVSVVSSGMDRNASLFNVSNIYVVKGAADSVWIFGFGYGDPDGDIPFYRGPAFDASRDALADARDVDGVITGDFGLARAGVKLQFVAPHQHLDHVNQEFVSAFLDSLGYSAGGARVLVHARDEAGSTCGLACCGALPCSGEGSPFFGVPFLPPWSTQALALFEAIGTETDSCGQGLLPFLSDTGTWWITKADTVHTAGALNLDNAALRVRIVGAAGSACDPPASWMVLPIHGNVTVPTSAGDLMTGGHPGDEGGARDPADRLIRGISPNPFRAATLVEFRIPARATVQAGIYDASGRRVKTLIDGVRPAGSHTARWDGTDDRGRPAASGVYLCRVAIPGRIDNRTLVLRR